MLLGEVRGNFSRISECATRRSHHIGGIVRQGLVLAVDIKLDGIAADGEACWDWNHARVEGLGMRLPSEGGSNGSIEIEHLKKNG